MARRLRILLPPSLPQMIPAIARQDDQNVLRGFKWRLVPFWADDPSIGNRMLVILKPGVYQDWITEDTPGKVLKEMLGDKVQ